MGLLRDNGQEDTAPPRCSRETPLQLMGDAGEGRQADGTTTRWPLGCWAGQMPVCSAVGLITGLKIRDRSC